MCVHRGGGVRFSDVVFGCAFSLAWVVCMCGRVGKQSVYVCCNNRPYNNQLLRIRYMQSLAMMVLHAHAHIKRIYNCSGGCTQPISSVHLVTTHHYALDYGSCCFDCCCFCWLSSFPCLIIRLSVLLPPCLSILLPLANSFSYFPPSYFPPSYFPSSYFPPYPPPLNCHSVFQQTPAGSL